MVKSSANDSQLTTAVTHSGTAVDRYDAFISYSHAADGALAPSLRNGLQRFATPWRVLRFTNPIRSLRVFQDQASLSANPKLWPTIEGALASSTWFILLASPVAATSPWVAKEVEFWCDHKTLDTLLIVQTDGEIAWNAVPGDFDWPKTTALPKRLVGVFPDEPRWIDARWARTSHQTSLRDPRFRDLVAELAAPLRGVPKDELIGEDIRQARRLALWRNAALALLTVLLVGAITAAVLAMRERDLAVYRLGIAQRNESRALATLAETELDGDGPATAIRIALAALPRLEGDRPFVAQAEAALLRGVEHLRERRRFFLPQSPVESFALSPDGRLLATGFQDGTIELWDIASGRALHVLRRAEASKKTTVSNGGQSISSEDAADNVRLAAFSPDGHMLLTGDLQATARRWDVASGTELASFSSLPEPGLSFTGTSAAASPDGRFVIFTGAEGPVPDAAPLWDAELGKMVILHYEIEPSERRSGMHQIAFATFSGDSRLLVTSSTDWTIRVWDARSARQLTALRGHTAALTFAAFSADGRNVVTAARDGTARLWELPSGKPITVFRGHEGSITGAAVDSAGHMLVTGSEDRTARLWNLTTGKELRVFRGYGDTVSSVAFSPDGQRILTTSLDKTARLWDTNSAKELLVLHTDSAIGKGIFLPDGLSVVTEGDGIVRMWDITPTPESSILLPSHHEEEIRSIDFSPDGQRVATAAWDNTARILSVGSLKDTALLRHPVFNVEFVSFSPDGRLVLTIAGDSIARVWDALANTEVPAFISARPIACAAFATDGHTLVTVGTDGAVREQNVSSGAMVSSDQVQEYRNPKGYFGSFRNAFAISADGRRLVVEWSDATIGIWDRASRRIISVLGGASVYRARFSADGQRLVTTDGSGVTSVWNTTSGRKLAVLRQNRGVRSAAFSADARTVVTVADGGEISLWDVDSGRALKMVGVHDARAVTFSPDGRSIATAGNDIRIWSVMPRGQALIEFGCAQVPWPLSNIQRERFGVTTEWCTPEVSDALQGKLRAR